jgi:ribosomal-protein-alanine N-acetyltransferase
MLRKYKYLSTGKRVHVSEPAADDEHEFVNLMRISARLHRGFVSPPTEPAAFRAFLSHCGTHNSQCYFVRVNENRAIVGLFNLSQIFMGGFRSAYLGYYAGAPFAGQGYMSVGLQLVMRDAFKRLKLHRIEANIQPNNVSSIALVTRAGFSREGYSRRYLKIGGLWRDHERWAILLEDWRRAKSSI